MQDKKQHPAMEETREPAEQHAEKLQRLQQDESRLWRTAVLFLALLATALAAESWQNLSSLPQNLEAIPIGTLVLALLFAAYVNAKRRQIAELQGMMRGIQERDKTPPSGQQLNRMLEAVSNSQRNYRELIDSLDDVVLGLSLTGTIRTANRAFIEMIGGTFADIVGHSLEEFLGNRRWSKRKNRWRGSCSSGNGPACCARA